MITTIAKIVGFTLLLIAAIAALPTSQGLDPNTLNSISYFFNQAMTFDFIVPVTHIWRAILAVVFAEFGLFLYKSIINIYRLLTQ